MSRLLLTSAGLKNKKIAQSFLLLLGKKPEEASAAVITVAARSPEQRIYVEGSMNELRSLGIHDVVELDAALVHPPETLDRFDVVYVCGGNTFFILQTFRETEFDHLLTSFVLRGGCYIGVSAGSIIAGPDITAAGYGSEGDPNDVGLHDMRGFNLVPFAVFPHFHEALRGEVEAFEKTVSYPVIPLTDEQAMLSVEGNVVRIG